MILDALTLEKLARARAEHDAASARAELARRDAATLEQSAAIALGKFNGIHVAFGLDPALHAVAGGEVKLADGTIAPAGTVIVQATMTVYEPPVTP